MENPSDPDLDRAARVMLLSPVRLSGARGRLLLDGTSEASLARQLRSAEGAPLGEVFSFVSGLYFRGKASYASRFAHASGAPAAAFVMCAGAGLCRLEERVDLERLRGWARVSIREDNPHFTAPLYRHASELLAQHDESARFVLLGSVATNKYVTPLLDVFGERLWFPREFLGRGDMSRGSLLLRAVKDGRELEYRTVQSLVSAEISVREP
ncbi:MAG TPA: hypothetical protein VFQ35_04120 [Polyangiaceae bacterium]|nr:hypothetical protein [Polyangiaceae bacterium]